MRWDLNWIGDVFGYTLVDLLQIYFDREVGKRIELLRVLYGYLSVYRKFHGMID